MLKKKIRQKELAIDLAKKKKTKQKKKLKNKKIIKYQKSSIIDIKIKEMIMILLIKLKI